MKVPAYMPSALVVAAILYLTLVPSPLPDTRLPLFPGADKLVHAAMFGGLALVLLVDASRSRRRVVGSAGAAALCLASGLFGGVIELLQMAMAMGRGAEWLDFAADLFGAAVAWIVWRQWASRIMRRLGI